MADQDDPPQMQDHARLCRTSLVKYAMGYEAFLASGILRARDACVCDRPSLLAMHPAVMESLIDEMQANRRLAAVPLAWRPPRHFRGLPIVCDARILEPHVITTIGRKLLI